MKGDERTEKATPKRRSETRKKGQVARSMELNSALILIAICVALKNLGQGAFEGISELMQYFLQSPASYELNEKMTSILFLNLSIFFIKAVLPIALIGAAVGVTASFLQVGFLLTPKPLVPDLKKINPMSGFKRILSPKSLVELLKSSIKIIVIGYVAYSIISDRFDDMINIINMDIRQTLTLLGSIAYEIGIKTGIALLIIAVFDYTYQRYTHDKSIRMTKQEIKEETKQSEGDPQIKSKIKRKQLEMTVKRMMQAVPTADVIITNPVRLAIALKYDSATMGAPKVVAKGQRLVAERIRDLAKEHNIPIFEDKILAQSLYKTAEVDKEIPFDLYKAVAEVLAYVYQINKGARVQGPSK